MIGPVASGVGAVIALIASSAFFFDNVQRRAAVDRALHSKTTLVPQTSFEIPERRIFYGARFLQDLKSKLGMNTVGVGTALDLYIRPILLWTDVFFAVCFGGFIILFWLAIWGVWGHLPHIQALSLFCGVMGFIYGAADVAEDLVLADLLSQSAPVSHAQALTAQSLTQLKLLSIVLSGAGGAAFLALQTAGRFVSANRDSPIKPELVGRQQRETL